MSAAHTIGQEQLSTLTQLKRQQHKNWVTARFIILYPFYWPTDSISIGQTSLLCAEQRTKQLGRVKDISMSAQLSERDSSHVHHKGLGAKELEWNEAFHSISETRNTLSTCLLAEHTQRVCSILIIQC